LTIIDLSFLENPRSNWVVVIGLELLSLACPGLGLGSDRVHHFIPVSPYQGDGYLDPTSVENRIWDDVSHPVPRKKERSLHTCAQDVQITRMATI
jgi:hypothetical protein